MADNFFDQFEPTRNLRPIPQGSADSFSAGPPGDPGQQTIVGPQNFDAPSTAAPPVGFRAPSAGGGAAPNAEVRTNNFAGMRAPGVAAGGGPEGNPSGWQHFDTPEAGVAAIGKQLDRYQSGAFSGVPITTLRGMVSTWAPSFENDTPLLIKRASEWTGVGPDQPIDMSSPDMRAKVITAFIRNEQGGNLPVDPAVIAKVAGSGNFFDQFEGNKGPEWRASPAGLAKEQADPDTQVRFVNPRTYLDLMKESEDEKSPSPSKSLSKSLANGDEIDQIPEVQVKKVGDSYKVTDYDGRRRAQAAIDAGLELIPVAFKGATPETKQIVGMNGQAVPFDFKPVPTATAPPSLLERGLKEVGRVGLKALEQTAEIPQGIAYGLAKPIVGLEQYAANAAQAFGVPGGAGAAQAVNQAATNLQEKTAALNPDAQGVANVADVGMSIAVPAGRMAEAGRLAQPLLGAAAGAFGGAVQPVPNVEQGGYGTQMNQNALLGTAVGAAGPVGAEGVNALRNMAQRFVTPTTVTRAASRLLGEDVSRLTPEVLSGVRARIGAVLDRIEQTHAVKFDDPLLRELATVDARARDVLGNEATPVVKALDNVLSRADTNGMISGEAAASTWRRGSLLDNLTDSRNSDIAGFAQRAQNAVRDALNRQLPAETAQKYSAARSAYRDLKIVEKTLRPGETRLSPQRFTGQVSRRFPDMAARCRSAASRSTGSRDR